MDKVVVTSRDLKIMDMIYKYDRVGASLLTRAFFQSLQACHRRTRLLVQAGYLTAQRMNATVPVGAGIYLYGLGKLGRKAVAEILELPESELRSLGKVSDPVFVDHHLEICNFRFALEQACTASGLVELVEWIRERELHAAKLTPEPDGEFVLQVGTKSQGYRLEIDRDTVTHKRISEKLRAYLKQGDPRPVLWVVPNQNRKQNLLKWALHEAGGLSLDPTVFWVTLKDSDPLGPVWDVAGGPSHVSLLGGGD